MSKAKEISARWEQIKPQIDEMIHLCYEVESHAEVTADAYQRGYEEGYKDGYNEPGKGKIQVGDEVNAGVGLKGIVTKIPKMVTDSFYYIMWDDGSCGHRNKDFIEQYKTGRTFPQIAELLKQMEEW